MLLQALGQRLTKGVIHMDHRHLEAHPFKQAGLGLTIGLPGAVIVQVIRRQVGEDGRVQLQSCQAVLHQANRRGLHHAGLEAGIHPAAQLAVQGNRIGRGQAIVPRLGLQLQLSLGFIGLHMPHPQRAHHRTRLIQLLKHMTEPPGAGGLAVGASDGHHGQLTAGLPVKRIGNPATGGFELRIRDHLVGVHAVQTQVFQTLVVDHASGSALVQHQRHIQTGIVPAPRPGQKAVARLNASAVAL